MSDDAAALSRLRRVWLAWAAAGLAGLGVAGLIVGQAFGAAWARWALVSTLAVGAILGFIWRRLPLNRSAPDRPLDPSPGLANHLTVARGILIGQLPGYLLLPEPAGATAWMPALTYLAAIVLDYLDGAAARRQGRVSAMGRALDIEFDGLAMLAGTALAVHYGRLPWLYLPTVGSARYLYLLAGWTARRFGRPTRPLVPSPTRRALAGVAMEVVAAALWPIAPAPLIGVAAAILGVPFLAGFARDAGIHLGLLDHENLLYRSARDRMVGIATGPVPLLLRLALPLLLVPRLLAGAFPYGGASAEAIGTAGLALTWAGLVLVVAGAAGRTGAVFVVVAYGIHLALDGFVAADAAAWGAAFSVYLLGTGPASLWEPERALWSSSNEGGG